MADKAYIVANEQQERELLEKLERDGFKWLGGTKPTEFRPSKGHVGLFPYAIYVGYGITWNILTKITSKEIVFDGRKEEQMSDKYVVSQEFMNKLEEWKDNLSNIDDGLYISPDDFIDLPVNIMKWRDDSKYTKENNNRLIAIIRWVNGEDVFEVEKPKKWVVRSKETNSAGDYVYVAINDFNFTMNTHHLNFATKFDTKEEAESWANAHQEVIEVEG